MLIISSRPVWFVLTIVALVTVFTADMFTPRGFSHGSLYMLVVLLSVKARSPRFVIDITLVSALLTIAGVLLSTPLLIEQEWVYAWWNRGFAILGLAIACALVLVHLSRELEQKSRQLLEQQLKTQHELLEVASEAGQLGGWSFDLVKQKLTWSDEVARIHDKDPGYSPPLEEALQYYPAEYRDHISTLVQHCIDDGTPFNEELQIVTATGRRIWVRAYGEAVRDVAGKIIRIQGAFQDIDNQKQAELREWALTRRLGATLENMAEAFVLLDRDWRISYLNSQAEKIVLRKREDLIGMNLWDAFPETVGSTFQVQYELAVMMQQPVHFEEFYAPLDKWIEISAYPSDEGLSVYFRDVSLRKDRETLRKWEGGVLESISTGVPIVQILQQVVAVSDGYISGAIASILRVDEDGKHLRNLSASNLPDAYNQAIEGLQIGPVAGSCGTAIYRKKPVIVTDIQTDPLWEDYRELADTHGLRACWSVPVFDISGTVLASYALYFRQSRTPTADDLTFMERKAYIIGIALGREVQQRELRISEERFRLLSRATRDAIWDWNLLTNEFWWNDGIETLFGYSREQIDPNIDFWKSHIHPDDYDRVVPMLKQVVRSGDAFWSAEYRFQRRDGSYAEVIDRGYIIRDAKGKGIRMIGGISDVTEQRQLEQQLHKSQRLEAVGQLTGGIAHDFNNLLTVIIGNAELISEQLDTNPKLQLLADMIGTAAQRGADLTQGLLAFARKQVLLPQSVNVDEMVNKMEGMLRRTLGEHIDIQLSTRPGLWPAMVDPAQLDSTLLNLCLNARDAMPAGGSLTIEMKNVQLEEDYTQNYPELKPGDYVLLAVSDTGCGIAAEKLSNVFEPFFTTKEKGKGTGLGLAMVYGFIKQSGGHVNIYSELGLGTTVKLYLPRLINQPDKRNDRTPVVELVTGGETILLVEDDELVREYAQGQLESLGYKVLIAENGVQALQTLSSYKDGIDLLFTDMIMPGGLNGKQLAEQAVKQRAGLNVLYTSGYTEDAVVLHGRLDPDVQLLSKPYRRQELATAIRQAIEMRNNRP